MSFEQAQMARAMASMVRVGTITAVDPATARAKVSFGGDTESAWLPLGVGRAGGARVWSPPVVGEQVVIVSPGGDTAQGVITASIACDAFPPPSSDGATYQISLPGGVVIKVAGGAVEITAPGKVKITGDVEIDGQVDVTGDVIAGGISLIHHKHGGVLPGPSPTGEPI